MRSSICDVALVVIASAICSTASAQAPATTPKLSTAELRAVHQFEKQLITKLNSKKNPADKYTYYVLMFCDTATSTTDSTSSSGRTVTLTRQWQLATKRDARMVQGRREAAITLAQYYSAANAAATRLNGSGSRLNSRVVAADGAKQWDYRPFLSESEAKAFLAEVTPPPDRTRP